MLAKHEVSSDDPRIEGSSGKLWALVGPSGSGKTTILRHLHGLVEFSGEIPQMPTELAALAGGDSLLVPVRAALIATASGLKNVELGLDLVRSRDDKESAQRSLEALGCAPFAQQSVASLSAGERARVALAVSLARPEPTLLIDEPTGNLDPETAALVVSALRRAADEGRQIVVSTHDRALIEAADQVVTLRAVGTCRPGSGLRRRSPLRPRLSTLLGLLWTLTGGARLRLAVALGSASLLLAVVLALVGLGKGMERTLLEDMLGNLPPNSVRVKTPTVSLGPLKFGLGNMDERLSDEAIEDMRDIDGVVAVHPQVFANYPVSARIDLRFPGMKPIRMGTDLALEGVEPEWIADEVDPEDFQWSPGDEGPVPVVISEQVFALYNAGFAKSQGLPRLSPKVVIGWEAKATLGKSSFAKLPKKKKIRARVVGVSKRTAPMGAAAPANFVRYWADELTGEVPGWTSAVVELEEGASAEVLVDTVDDLGLRLEEDGGLKSVRDATKVLDRIGGAIALVFSGVAMVLVLLVLLGRFNARTATFDGLELNGLSPGSLRLLQFLDGLLLCLPMLLLALLGGTLLGLGAESILLENLDTELGIDYIESLFALPMEPVVKFGLVLLFFPPIVLALRASLRLRTPLVERLSRGD